MAKSTRVLLCIATMLMGAVSGVRGHFESSNMFFENEAAIQVDSESCAVTGAHEVCHTVELESGYTVHVCPNDGECGTGLCYYSPVPLCCPNAKGLVCKSVSTLLIEGRRINVTHHRVTRMLSKDDVICLSFTPAMNVCDKDCERRCITAPDCVENVECDSEEANCKCREGFTEESECCECAEGYYRNGTRCIKYCRENCRTTGNSNGQPSGCASCHRGFLPYDCCNCPPNLVKRDGVCKCRANLKTDGTCVEGTLEPDCCECDTTGNVTHAFYKTPSGECKPFCKNNCAVTSSSGCTTCKDGFITEPECCQRTDDCDQPQNLFFYIDATSSNTFENFCPLIIVLQMIVAAFSPSPSSGIQIGSLLFSDNARRRGPSPVFETDTSCLNAVQGEDHSLRSLVQEFGICLDEHRRYDSTKFPSMCGEGTSAVLGLERISEIVRTKSAHKSTVLMITDGIIEDGVEERTTCLSELESAGVTIIEAGYGDADLSTMKLYTDRDNIMIDDDPVELGKAIVNKLKVKGILCDKYAKNVIESLEQAQVNNLPLFCRCHRMEYIDHPLCRNKKYPICGGDLSIGINPTGPGMSETLDFQESDLEEEILAAVENVLERFNGH